MSQMTSIMISLDKGLLAKLDFLVSKIGRKTKGRAFNRSQWIREAIEKQLKIEMGLSFLKER